jgi:hypothetical protein
MTAICIDGKPRAASISLPEGVPLEVDYYSDTHYWVIGYDYCEILNMAIVWNKNRFIPPSTAKENEVASTEELTTA